MAGVVLAGVAVDVFWLKPAGALLIGPVVLWRVLLAGLVFAVAVAAGLYTFRSAKRSGE
ncbi:hypothetical protein D3C78_1937160 [compost metagenome]